MVAKSFQDLEQVGAPFESGGKMYVNVRGKNGNVRRVRWYEVDEYIKMYPDTPRAEIDPYYKTMKRTLFGDSEYVWIFKPVTHGLMELLEQSSYIRFHTYWGWYARTDIPDEVMNGLVERFVMRQLYWSDIAIDENTLKPQKEVERIVKGVLNI